MYAATMTKPPRPPEPHRPALNLRPCPPALRVALRQLARAKGQRMHPYILALLADHVAVQTGAQVSDFTEDFGCLTGRNRGESVVRDGGPYP
jgi:hypothetical protein